MTQTKLIVENLNGIHARPSAEIVRTAANFPSCEVNLYTTQGKADAKSIMGILMLRILHGTEVTITAEGEGEKELIENIETLFSKKFGLEE